MLRSVPLEFALTPFQIGLLQSTLNQLLPHRPSLHRPPLGSGCRRPRPLRVNRISTRTLSIAPEAIHGTKVQQIWQVRHQSIPRSSKPKSNVKLMADILLPNSWQDVEIDHGQEWRPLQLLPHQSPLKLLHRPPLR